MRRMVLLLMCMVSPAGAVGAGAQEVALSQRGPRFLVASTGRDAVEIDPAKAPVFQRRVTLALERTTVGEALAMVGRQAGIRLVYSRDVLDPRAPARIKAEGITVAGALTEILLDAGVDVVLSDLNRVTLAPRALPPPPPAGALGGRVTDAESGAAVEGAEVFLQGTQWRALTGADGRYHLADIDTGSYIASVRRIGYGKLSRSVTVLEGQETTADFALQQAATKLDELVTTGTMVPTEVKALPTPVTVITEEDIALQRPQTLLEVFRKAVPGAVAWVSSATVYNTQFSVRGASSLVPSSTSMKVFVDGLEVANGGYAQVDPNSVARIEVIRGPQAAAIYGSEAIGGVIQVFTKRGDPSLSRPRVGAEAGVGIVQTPYAGLDGVLRQEYKASLRGGAPHVGYYVGAGYSHMDDWIPPDGEISRQSSPSLYGGINFARGMISLDFSGRYYSHNGGNRIINPELLESGFTPVVKASHQPLQVQSQTLGGRLSVAPTPWWRNTLTLGVDRLATDIAQTQPRLTTPTDTLLLVANNVEMKPSLGLNTTVESPLGPDLAGSLTVGFDHWTYTLSGWATLGALTTTGTIPLAPGQSVTATRTITDNTGYFAQAQLGFRDVLFVTTGLRAEQNSEFGDDLGTPLLPRVGLSFVQPLAGATLKLRGSWGRAIKPPTPGAKVAFASALGDQLPNPHLGPEQQQGWDAGADVTLGSRGSVSVTYYDQTADNLIDRVVLQVTPVRQHQFQNVGRVKNSGVELEGALAIGPATLQAQYGYARARVEQLSPTYAGELRVGDQPRMRPKHTAGVSLSVTPAATTTVSAGLAYIGSWTNTDIVAQFRCLGQTGPCRPTSRDYLMTYPALVKLNAAVVQQFTSALAAFISVDNLTNNHDHEINNLSPVTGRSSTVGLRLQY